MMHPRPYLDGSHVTRHRIARPAAGSDRLTRLFFAGNVSRGLHSSPVSFRGADQVPRSRVIFTLLSQSAVELLADPAAMRRIVAGPRWAVLDTSARRISDDDWLDVLAEVDIFLAPGVGMPFAHNIIEAMVTGAIPVTQYGDLFDPPLRDGITCIAYGPDDLGARIAEIRAMPRDDVREMRRAVLEHCAAHLRPEAIGAALRSGLAGSAGAFVVDFPYA